MEDLSPSRILDPAGKPEQMIADGLKYAWVHQAAHSALSEPDGLKVFVRGEGSKLYDIYGEEYLDGLSGAWVANIGHGRQEVAEAMAKQATELAYTSAFNFLTPPAIELARKLVELAPQPLARAFLGVGGTDAVEAALAMARQYFVNTGVSGRSMLIGRRTSYHGSTFGGKSLSGFRHAALQQRFGPLLPGIFHVAPPNSYRCEYCREQGKCSLQCAREIENVIVHEGPEAVCAVIGETISVSGDTVIPDPGYWPAVREICDRYGVLLILDEVLVGMGRTGKWFAFEHFNVVPDIVTLSKGIASGYAPISAALAAEKVAGSFMGGPAVTLSHGYTYGNHPVSCAAGLKNIEILEREKLVERSADMGKYLMERLQELWKHQVVGDIRGGLGLLAVVEVVKDRETRQRLGPEAQFSSLVMNWLMEKRVFLRVWDVIQIAPPFVVTKDEIDQIVDAIDYALGNFDRE
jgi:adenosylmethionine-8-amino-7-oxononanoate aminotransferase